MWPFTVLWKSKLVQSRTMPSTGWWDVPDVAHAVPVVEDIDWDAVVPLCGRRPVPAHADPDRDFANVPLIKRCPRCEELAGRL
ncbi:hypothetical protein [Catenulispora pinisilvae]|uniref:hypothetical protein n=1 Tax=Catenulispora pinisilvae TaxID=2705253 RepID=UPI001892653F|nr:hypothetical protein [Catenulispora pinisilvae]